MNKLFTRLSQETERAILAELDLASLLKALLQAESFRAVAAELATATALEVTTSGLAAEIFRGTNIEEAIMQAAIAEVTRTTNADTALQGQIDDILTILGSLQNKITGLENPITE